MLKRSIGLISIFLIGGCMGSSMDPGEMIADQYPGLRGYFCPIANSKYGEEEKPGWETDVISEDINDLVEDSPARTEVGRQKIVDNINNTRIYCIYQRTVKNEFGEEAKHGFIHPNNGTSGDQDIIELAILDYDTGEVESWKESWGRWELAKGATRAETGNLYVVYTNDDWGCAAGNCDKEIDE